MNIFSYLNYRNYIRDCISQNSSSERVSQTKLAEALGVKGPFLSKVISGSANLSTDHAFLFSNFFELKSEERYYLNLLIQYEKSGLETRKEKLLEEIKAIQLRTSQTIESIGGKSVSDLNNLRNEYYLDPVHILVHMSLTLEKFAENSQGLSSLLQITPEHLSLILKNLESLGLIAKIGSRFVLTDKQFHLDPKDKICHPHQQLMRELCAHRNNRKQDDDYNLTISFSCSLEDKEKIKHRFLEFLKEFDEVLMASKDEAVFQLNFDLFKWLE